MLRSHPPSPTANSVLADALKLLPDDQAVVSSRLLRRWIEMETGADKGISGAALIRKLRALATKKK